MPTLGDLAQRYALKLTGDPAVEIRGVCALEPGQAGKLSFLFNARRRSLLEATRAAAVVLSPGDAAGFRGNALIAPDPHLAFARIAALFDTADAFIPGVHPDAVIAPGIKIPASSHVAAQCVIEAGVEIGAHTFMGPGSVIRRGARIGDRSRLEARVYLGPGVQLGMRCRIQPGAVIGSRGFGLVRGAQGWEEVPQLGSVRIGDDVEVGANTTIDRGTLDDTVLENGVKLDNQIHIAHNVHIGAHTAVAACVGVAGSTRIGARCMIGGAAVLADHIEIGDDVVVQGYAMVTKSLKGPGQYGSGLPVQPAREWRRSIARLHRLERFVERLVVVERRLGIERSAQGESSRESDDV
ncbi:MAG: UDP-3-O-(3-hydroxymyristoyl)glucosamine N-acyltransferase [Nevskiales bacterium]|nr:UDP-3-O-(3-hydroxymyristoyl)glucosamine N-acyltransferase [Nevskiales bacterium]